jgi:hypothetical protein
MSRGRNANQIIGSLHNPASSFLQQGQNLVLTDTLHTELRKLLAYIPYLSRKVCRVLSEAGVFEVTSSDNKVRELITVKVPHTSLLNITVAPFKVLPLGSYKLMPAPSQPFERILELVLWNGLVILSKCQRLKTKFCGFSSQANYTVQATAVCRRS